MTRSSAPIVVIGVGNVLLGDDGVGVRVVEALRRVVEADPRAVPPGTRLLDGGTLGLSLLDEVRSARALLLVDAANAILAPGAIGVWRDVQPGTLAVARGMDELLSVAGLLNALPAAVTLVGVGIGEVAAGIELTEPVAAAVPRAVTTVRGELRWLDTHADSPIEPASRERARRAMGAHA